MLFRNREDGGRKLGIFLHTQNFVNPIVIGLPRGGVVTAREVATILKCPLELVIVRKIGSPVDPEYGIGAMSEDGECFFSPAAALFDLESEEVKEIIEEEKRELKRRVQIYRGHELNLPSSHTFILVDDGIATGVTAIAAVKFLKKFNAKKIIFACPVGPRLVSRDLRDLCDEIYILERPSKFLGVGNWYEDFQQTTDEEVLIRLRTEER